MQPTCPFIKPARIKDALERFANGAGSVITVVDDRHLGWVIDEAGNPKPDYAARVNRQLLPPKFKESGAIIGARIADIVRTGTRIVEPINLVEVPDGESLDIDTFSDWAVAEHLASRKRILIRTDAAKELGMGHVYRSLALAYSLARHDLTIVLSADKPLGKEFFAEYPFAVDTVENDLAFLNYARKHKADLVILDRLDNAAEFVTLLSGHCKVVTFEDLGSGAEVADMLIADMYENPKVPDARQLKGMENAILAPSFESIDRQIEFKEQVEEVLVLFGGTDPSNLADKALRALEFMEFDGRVTVVRGLGADLIDPRSYKLKIKVLSNVKNMPAVMEKADIALSSAGRTITELASMGIPTVCMAQNEKELTHTHVATQNGVLMLGLGRLVSVETLAAHLIELSNNDELRFKLHERGLQATTGRTNDRIVRRIMKQIGF
jgi:spore coat polysaccharide biosynthesis predicted glycosyltransferase SpsG